MEGVIILFVSIVFFSMIVGMVMLVVDYYKNERRHEEQLDEDNYEKTINTEFEDNYNISQEFDKDE